MLGFGFHGFHLASARQHISRHDRLPAPPPALPLVTSITNNITRILGCNPGPFTLQGTNCYVISHTDHKDAWLIDTGAGHPRFLQLLQKHLAYHNKQLCAVFITHRHDDHVGGLPALLASPLGATIVHVFKYLVAGESAAIPGTHPPATYTTLHDNQMIQLGNTGMILQTIFTPGHCSDHCCFLLHTPTHGATGCTVAYEPTTPSATHTSTHNTVRSSAREKPMGRSINNMMLCSGDNVLGSGTTVMENLAAYMNSLYHMRAVMIDRAPPSAADCLGTAYCLGTADTHHGNHTHDDVNKDTTTDTTSVMICPGHGDVVYDGVAKVEGYIQHRQAREAQILCALPNPTHTGTPQRHPMTAHDLVHPVYGPKLPHALRGAAAWNVFQHLDKLANEGKVEPSPSSTTLLQEYRTRVAKGDEHVAVESRSRGAVQYKQQLVNNVAFVLTLM